MNIFISVENKINVLVGQTCRVFRSRRYLLCCSSGVQRTVHAHGKMILEHLFHGGAATVGGVLTKEQGLKASSECVKDE